MRLTLSLQNANGAPVAHPMKSSLRTTGSSDRDWSPELPGNPRKPPSTPVRFDADAFAHRTPTSLATPPPVLKWSMELPWNLGGVDWLFSRHVGHAAAAQTKKYLMPRRSPMRRIFFE